MYWQRVKRTILARFTLFFLRNPYPELALNVSSKNERYSCNGRIPIYWGRIGQIAGYFRPTFSL